MSGVEGVDATGGFGWGWVCDVETAGSRRARANREWTFDCRVWQRSREVGRTATQAFPSPQVEANRVCREARRVSEVTELHWQPIRKSAQRSVSTHRLYVRVEASPAQTWSSWQPASVVAASRVKSPIVWRVPMADRTANHCGWVHRLAQFACRTDSPSSSIPPRSRELRSSPWPYWSIAFPAGSARPIAARTAAPWHPPSAPQRSILAALSDTQPDTKAPTRRPNATVS